MLLNKRRELVTGNVIYSIVCRPMMTITAATTSRDTTGGVSGWPLSDPTGRRGTGGGTEAIVAEIRDGTAQCGSGLRSIYRGGVGAGRDGRVAVSGLAVPDRAPAVGVSGRGRPLPLNLRRHGMVSSFQAATRSTPSRRSH